MESKYLKGYIDGCTFAYNVMDQKDQKVEATLPTKEVIIKTEPLEVSDVDAIFTEVIKELYKSYLKEYKDTTVADLGDYIQTYNMKLDDTSLAKITRMLNAANYCKKSC